MTPRVSIVVPAYNNADFIGETIESILAQTYRDFELVIADHASTDATLDVVSTFSDPRIRVEHTDAGGGAKRNWDRVSRLATGDYLKLVCGDDLISPTSIEEQLAAFERHPSVVLVASQRALVDAAGKTIIGTRGLGTLSGLVAGRDAARAAVLAGSNIFGEPGCVLMRRDVLERIGWWDNDHPFLIDQATFTEVALQGDVVALRKSLASFRVNAGQWSVRLAREQAAQAAGFHHKLRRDYPDLLSRNDVRIGNARALLTSFLRRAVYVLLRRRITHRPSTQA